MLHQSYKKFERGKDEGIWQGTGVGIFQAYSGWQTGYASAKTQLPTKSESCY